MNINLKKLNSFIFQLTLIFCTNAQKLPLFTPILIILRLDDSILSRYIVAHRGLEPEVSSLLGMRSKEKIFSFVLMLKYTGSKSRFGIYKYMLRPFNPLRIDSVDSFSLLRPIPGQYRQKIDSSLTPISTFCYICNCP